MNVDITGARIYFTIPIFGGIPITATIVNSLLVTLIIIGLSIFITRNLKVRAVSRRQVVAEFLVETAQNFVNGNMGEKFAYYGPFVAALFASSLFSSLLSLVGMFPPTSDLSTTLAWAVMAATRRLSCCATSSVCRPMEPVEPKMEIVLLIIPSYSRKLKIICISQTTQRHRSTSHTAGAAKVTESNRSRMPP